MLSSLASYLLGGGAAAAEPRCPPEGDAPPAHALSAVDADDGWVLVDSLERGCDNNGFTDVRLVAAPSTKAAGAAPGGRGRSSTGLRLRTRVLAAPRRGDSPAEGPASSSTPACPVYRLALAAAGGALTLPGLRRFCRSPRSRAASGPRPREAGAAGGRAVQQRRATQNLKRGPLERLNKARDNNARNKVQRRSDRMLQHSGANNNRKC
ncbi:Tumor protein p53-inducible nuclear protein 1 [Gryllus bimaculatus]|nr:Tumor protein p53-inducible nuclear protein 1 [Gryllus bimaculatus]